MPHGAQVAEFVAPAYQSLCVRHVRDTRFEDKARWSGPDEIAYTRCNVKQDLPWEYRVNVSFIIQYTYRLPTNLPTALYSIHEKDAPSSRGRKEK